MNLDNLDLVRAHIHNVKMNLESMDPELYITLLESFLDHESKDDIIKALEYENEKLAHEIFILERTIEDFEDEGYDLKDEIDRLQEALDEAKSKGFV